MEIEKKINEANGLFKQGRLKKASSIYQNILSQDSSNVFALHGLSHVYIEQENFSKAIEEIQKILFQRPNDIEALNNMAECFRRIGEFEKALKVFLNIKKIQPENSMANKNLALVQLIMGDYKNGFLNYQSRLEFRKSKLKIPKTYEWLGDKDLKQKTIFISSEQGIGDYFQFCRYLPMVHELGAKIILDAPLRLKPMLNSLKINFKYVGESEKFVFQYHCPLISLPLSFQTTINNIPNKTPYLFTPKEKKNYWEKKLGKKRKKRIGIMHTTHLNDKNRSLKLNQLDKLLKLPFDFHSLQISFTDEDKKYLLKSNIALYESEIEDFEDAAGLIDQMDLIITVDQTVAHLCGALGAKTWVMLPFIPDFRWLLRRTDSPWYPSVKLYRQSSQGNWMSVIEKIKKDLLTEFS